ncbi:LysR family transcriptional regulator [Rubritalea marina]|uniref:LysR family transcriptional regulator n=1 Tax=Rubritalea marina TaxID=361055 RepID=UPI00037724B4|nr:LysR family transcriptional regulator [Rubritalea marina]
MNLHHLELFYYVAKYEGITSAVGKMPYSVQQPAISSQLQTLEKELSVKLFNRRPFQLTTEGEKLYDYIYPFFSRLGELKDYLSGEGGNHLRIAASDGIIRHHLPSILDNFRSIKPDLKLTLDEVDSTEIAQLLCDEMIDVAISVLLDEYPRGTQVIKLITLPMALLVPKEWKLGSLNDLFDEHLWNKHKVGNRPLVSGQANELLVQKFNHELSKRNLVWPPSLQLSTQEFIRSYVERGFGAGLTVVTPGVPIPEGYKYFILEDFPALEIGILHRKNLKPIGNDFIQIVEMVTQQLL